MHTLMVGNFSCLQNMNEFLYIFGVIFHSGLFGPDFNPDSIEVPPGEENNKLIMVFIKAT